MRLLLIASLLLSPLAFTTGCASNDDDVVRQDTKTRTTYGDGESKTTKTEKTTRVNKDVDD